MHARSEDDALGDGEMLNCRSMDRLYEWAKEGDRNACFRMVDDFKPTAHTLEKYQYCDPYGPYYDTMVAYFREYGHQPLFVEEMAEGNPLMETNEA